MNERIKAVILGETLPNDKLSPSWINVLSEYTKDLHYPWPTSNDFSKWHREGVLVFDPRFAVNPDRPGDTAGLWDDLIQETLDELCNRQPRPVFILWGVHARSVFGKRHAPTIVSGHPDPVSSRSFFGSRPFTRCNAILTKYSIPTINWRLP